MLHGPRSTVDRARRLRREMSWPEVILWRLLRQRPCGLKFRRQHPAGPYVLDFFCAEAKVAIEIDGLAHDMDDRAARDAVRDAWLGSQGVEIVRVSAAEVTRSPDDIAQVIVQGCLARRKPLHQPSAGPPPRFGEET